MTPRRGRPSGYTLNPDAFKDVLGEQSQARIAAMADMSPSFLSEMLAGNKGATAEVADRLAGVLKVRRGTLFPELVMFRVEYREFTVPSRDSVPA